MTGSSGRVLVVVLVVALLVSGCTSAGDDGETERKPTGVGTAVVTPPPEPPGIRLSFIQQRFDEGTAKAGIRVMNHSGARLTVRRVGLDWPGYPGGPQRRPYVVYDDQAVDLRYWLPRPDCSPDHLDTTPVGVVVTPARTLRRPIDAQGLRFLTRIWQAACNERLLHRTVRLRYDGPWRDSVVDGETALVGGLVLTRQGGDEPVEATQVQGSPLFDLALGDTRTLAAADRRTVVPLQVTSGGRCDPHSRAAVTTPFTFRVWVRIGGQEVAVVAVPGKAAQRAMLAFLDRACAAG